MVGDICCQTILSAVQCSCMTATASVAKANLLPVPNKGVRAVAIVAPSVQIRYSSYKICHFIASAPAAADAAAASAVAAAGVAFV